MDYAYDSVGKLFLDETGNYNGLSVKELYGADSSHRGVSLCPWRTAVFRIYAHAAPGHGVFSHRSPLSCLLG